MSFRAAAIALLMLLALVCHHACGTDANRPDDNKCRDIGGKRWREMEECATKYWTAMVFPRSAALDQLVLNCMNDAITSAPFGINTTQNKEETSAGYLKVSTQPVDALGASVGPFFENCTKTNILEVISGCSGEIPYVAVRVDRTFYYNITGETFSTQYMSTFRFVKSSNAHKDPAVAAPDYTIVHYTYQPSSAPMLRHWPGTPVSPDANHIFYVCELLRARCGNDIDWSPYPTCVQWVNNHPYTENYLPVFALGHGYCVFMVVFFGTTYIPSHDPYTNLCPFISACTGNPYTYNGARSEFDTGAAFSQFLMRSDRVEGKALVGM